MPLSIYRRIVPDHASAVGCTKNEYYQQILSPPPSSSFSFSPVAGTRPRLLTLLPSIASSSLSLPSTPSLLAVDVGCPRLLALCLDAPAPIPSKTSLQPSSMSCACARPRLWPPRAEKEAGGGDTADACTFAAADFADRGAAACSTAPSGCCAIFATGPASDAAGCAGGAQGATPRGAKPEAAGAAVPGADAGAVAG
eukprot:1137139-Pelagomonas_calceolata.AAC.6